MKEPGKIKWMRLIRGIFLGILLVLTMTPAALGAQKTVLVHNVDEMRFIVTELFCMINIAKLLQLNGSLI